MWRQIAMAYRSIVRWQYIFSLNYKCQRRTSPPFAEWMKTQFSNPTTFFSKLNLQQSPRKNSNCFFIEQLECKNWRCPSIDIRRKFVEISAVQVFVCKCKRRTMSRSSEKHCVRVNVYCISSCFGAFAFQFRLNFLLSAGKNSVCRTGTPYQPVLFIQIFWETSHSPNLQCCSVWWQLQAFNQSVSQSLSHGA